MKKLFALILVVASLLALAGVASAEHGNIGGINLIYASRLVQ